MPEEVQQKSRCRGSGRVSGGIYGLGFIGAAVYYIGHAAGFWDGVLGLLKSFVWPAFLVYKLMEYLQM